MGYALNGRLLLEFKKKLFQNAFENVAEKELPKCSSSNWFIIGLINDIASIFMYNKIFVSDNNKNSVIFYLTHGFNL